MPLPPLPPKNDIANFAKQNFHMARNGDSGVLPVLPRAMRRPARSPLFSTCIVSLAGAPSRTHGFRNLQFRSQRPASTVSRLRQRVHRDYIGRKIASGEERSGAASAPREADRSWNVIRANFSMARESAAGISINFLPPHYSRDTANGGSREETIAFLPPSSFALIYSSPGN